MGVEKQIQEGLVEPGSLSESHYNRVVSRLEGDGKGVSRRRLKTTHLNRMDQKSHRNML